MNRLSTGTRVPLKQGAPLNRSGQPRWKRPAQNRMPALIPAGFISTDAA